MPLDVFCNLDNILMSPDGKPWAMIDEALDRIGRSRRVVMTLPFMGSVCRCVAGDDVVSMIPRQFAEHLADGMGLSLYEPLVVMSPHLIGMAWHRRTTASAPH